MDKTKKIYFLFSFVMIIACYALNKSYSMFVASEEKNVVDSVVPNLVSELSVSSITLSGNEEYLIKETITNTSSVSINYALNANGSNYTIKMTSDDGNKVLGSLETNQSDIVYLYVKNDSTESNTITFELNKNYTTLNNDLTSNIDNTNLYTPVTGATVPYQNEPNTLKYHILNNYINSDLYAGTAPSQTNTTAVEAFNGKTENTIKLPLSTGTVEIPELTTINSVETEEKGLYKAPDDYGDSYYFRGASTKNYVSFAGFTWRIVRINGDGSVRLIAANILRDANGDDIKPLFNTDSKDNAYIGYMYGLTGQTSTNTNQCVKLNSDGTKAEVDTANTTEETCVASGNKWASTPYDATHVNVASSTIKTTLDSWYKTNIIDTNYEDYIADTLFCGDKSLASNSLASGDTSLGYGTNTTYYSAYERINNNKPSLECAKGVNNTYSRYTANSIKTLKNVLLNNDLTYPIGLLSVDEGAFAGGHVGVENTYFYLAGFSSSWWFLTPYTYTGSGVAMWRLNYKGDYYLSSSTISTPTYVVRPVINLKADIEVESGNGTNDDNIYKVKLPVE